jgi:oligoendopeptidase F
MSLSSRVNMSSAIESAVNSIELPNNGIIKESVPEEIPENREDSLESLSDSESDSESESAVQDEETEKTKFAFATLLAALTSTASDAMDTVSDEIVINTLNLAMNVDVQGSPGYEQLLQEFNSENEKITSDSEKEVNTFDKELAKKLINQQEDFEEVYNREFKAFREFEDDSNRRIATIRQKIQERRDCVEKANEKRRRKAAENNNTSRNSKINRITEKREKRKNMFKKRFIKKFILKIQKNKSLFE